MATESVKILIEAEDEASAKIAIANKALMAADKEAAAAFDRFEKIKNEQLELLKLEKIALEQGAEAAESMRLQIQGLDSDTADMIAREKQVIQTLKEEAKERERLANQQKRMQENAGGSGAKNTKASAEFLGTIANFAGGGLISQVAGQVGQLTDKASQFTEVAEQGKLGAFAFKAGLVAAAGAIAFQVGSAIGNVIFQTEKWNKELEKAVENSKKLQQAVMSAASGRFGDSKADIELIRDPEKKEAAYKNLLADLKTNILGVESQVKSSQKSVDEWNAAWQITGNRKGFAQQAGLQLEQDKERLKVLQDQQKEIERLLTIEAEREQIRKKNAGLDSDEQYLKTLDKQISMLEAIKADSQIDLQVNVGGLTEVEKIKQEIALIEQRKTGLATLQEQAKQSTSGFVSDTGFDGAKEAEAKLLQIKLLEKQNELEKVVAEEKRQRLKELADAEFAAVMNAEKAFQSERDRLAEQKVLLDKGAEAAHAFRLAKQGLSEEDAKSFAKQQTELDKQKQVQEKLKARETAAPLQAISSRFLTRGPTDDKMLDVAKTQLKVQQEQLAELKKPKGSVNVRDIRLVEVG